MKRLAGIGAVVIGLALPSCGGDAEKATTSSSPVPPAGAPSEGTTTPGDPGALPPEFVKCMAYQGYEVESSANVHSAPPQVLQACFGSLHGSGGAP